MAWGFEREGKELWATRKFSAAFRAIHDHLLRSTGTVPCKPFHSTNEGKNLFDLTLERISTFKVSTENAGTLNSQHSSGVVQPEFLAIGKMGGPDAHRGPA